MSRSLKRSVWALMAAPSRIEQLSAISSILPNTSNTSLGGCPPGSYPSARWRKYSERDKQHFLANIVTFFFSVTVTRMLMQELGLYDLTPAMCHLDYTMSEAGGVTNFVRQYTLASGGPYCDCGYKKKRV